MLPFLCRTLPSVLLIALVTGLLAHGGEQKTDGPPLVIRVDGKYGYIDRTGNVLVKPQFPYAREFVEGMACVALGEDLGKQWTYVMKPAS